MKNVYIFTGLVFILAASRLFIACDQPTSNSSGNNTPAQTCTIAFSANGGTPEPQFQIVNKGDKVTEPAAMSKDGYGFGGWYKEAACTNQWDFDIDAVTKNITLYAKWEAPTLVPGANFNQKLQWLASNAQSGGFYTIEVDSDLSIGPITLSYNDKSNITISLIGIGPTRVISLNDSGSLFTVQSGVTLILDDNLTLQGRDSNSASLIQVNSGASLIVNTGITITGNTTSSNGGGVYVNDGSFTMNSGKISGNTASSSGGGGVYMSSGIFTMSGGQISGNISSSLGGGVYVNDGTFSMSGGQISGNISSSSSSLGGGVYVNSSISFTMNGGAISGNKASYGGGLYVAGTFSMNSGEISGNTASSSSSFGGGVYVCGGSFTMNGGKISGNTASFYGGGVDIIGTFTMNNGEISGNTVTLYGGGVYFAGTFNMNGGTISDNTAALYGGGVYVYGGQFNKTGGTIFGYSASDTDSNVVKTTGVVQQNHGHAIHVNSSNTIYIMGRDTTSGPDDNLSFDGYTNPPSYSGLWDY